jgi:protein ImuB
MPVACALAPRFRLLTAVGGETGEGRELLRRPSALAPEPGAAQLVGEVSDPAERLGVRAGMRLGEALSRCPELALVPPDPDGADRAWELALRGFESVGAEVESERAGEAFFEAEGLRGLWGGIAGVLDRARSAVGMPVVMGAAPGRFCAYAAARRADGAARAGDGRGPASPVVVPGAGARRFLSPLPVSLLSGRLASPGRWDRPAWSAATGGEDAGDDLPNELERLGIATLGRLAGLAAEAVADRFGAIGLRALRLARGEDDPLRPRRPHERLAVELELPDATSGQQLGHALELLVARLLSHPERRGRTLRSLRLSARLAAGGGWARHVALCSAAGEGERLLLALSPLLELLPGPASVLRLEAVSLGAAAGEQLSLAGPGQRRRKLIAEAVRQARAAGGSEAVLRVLEVDPESRVPERREVLMPFPEDQEAARPPRDREGRAR